MESSLCFYRSRNVSPLQGQKLSNFAGNPLVEMALLEETGGEIDEHLHSWLKVRNGYGVEKTGPLERYDIIQTSCIKKVYVIDLDAHAQFRI